MTTEPLNIPKILQSFVWPSVAVAVIVVFLKPAAEIANVSAERLIRISVAGVFLGNTR